jgi:hypothetical protein
MAVASGVSMRRLFELAESSHVHSLETEDGQIMICRESVRGLKDGGW